MKTPYRRKVIKKTKNYEIIEITWPPGVKSLPHDHGNSRGTIWVLRGAVFEERYKEPTKSFLGRKVCTKGMEINEYPDLIHVMGNNSNKEIAVTLHVYMPPLKMKFFKEKELTEWSE